jgi:hypothetical protein
MLFKIVEAKKVHINGIVSRDFEVLHQIIHTFLSDMEEVFSLKKIHFRWKHEILNIRDSSWPSLTMGAPVAAVDFLHETREKAADAHTTANSIWKKVCSLCG